MLSSKSKKFSTMLNHSLRESLQVMVVLKIELQQQQERLDANAIELINILDRNYMAIEQQIEKVSSFLEVDASQLSNRNFWTIK